VRLLSQVGSTQDLIQVAARAGEPEGLCVIADHQVHGRGRAGRAWQAPPGSSLMLSLLLRPPDSGRPTSLPLVVGLAVARGIEAAGGPPVRLKWPNDCLIGSRKVAGVLVESLWTDWGRALAVGVGCNVFWEGVLVDDALASRATALDREGWRGSGAGLAAEVLASLSDHYRSWSNVGFAALRDSWLERAEWIGEEVQVASGPVPLVGRLEGVDDEGRLLVTGPHRRVAVAAGDLSAGPFPSLRPARRPG
jgi:BirA family biotin operon repressor/biotin-[acetyl-CoA-carboxylase] ligase